jgi:hypothetical protein
VLNIGAGSLTAVSVTGKVGAWVELGAMNIVAAGLLVKDVTEATTYAMGTDYIVNYRLGTLKVLETGAIADNAVLKVTATFSAISGTQIAGGKNSQIRAKFRFDGKNFADGLPVIVDVHEAVIAADSSFDFLADDFAAVSLPGRLKTPVGYDAPFHIKLLDAAI